jgi:hypothetical protein
MREPPQDMRGCPTDPDREAPSEQSVCGRAPCRQAGVENGLVVASNYALPESTLSLLAGLVGTLAAKGAKTEAA